jgi:hypothetical protein
LLPAKEARLDVLRESLASQPEAGDPVAAAWRALTAWAPPDEPGQPARRGRRGGFS